MNKKVMALAVAGALAAPAVAFAQASNVQIYGRANVGFGSYEATGSTSGTAEMKARNRVWDTGSRLGFRVNEDLGGGMRAFIQLENGVNFDNGGTTGQGGQGNSSAGTFASRDSFAGIGGSWGDVRFGRQSVYWANSGVRAQTGANYVDTEIGFANGASFGRIAGPSARTNNVLSYNSPTISGFSGSLYYAPQSEAQQQSTTQNTDGLLTAITLRYNGVINAQLDIANNNQQTSSAVGFTQQKLSGTKIGVGYPYMPGAQIALLIVNNTNTIGSSTMPAFTGNYGAANGYSAMGAAGDQIKQRAMVVNWEHMFGNIQALAMYGKLNKATGCGVGNGCDDTDATAFMVGVKYHLSKRTGVYATINRTTNKANQFSDYGGAAYTSNTSAITTMAGADPRTWAIGVMHNF